MVALFRLKDHIAMGEGVVCPKRAIMSADQFTVTLFLVARFLRMIACIFRHSI